MKSIITRYLLVSILSILLVAVIGYILETYFQVNIGSAGSIITVMVPALDAGTNYFKKFGEAPTTGTRWRYAMYFSLIQIAFAGVILALFISFIPNIPSIGAGLWSAIIVFYSLLIFITSRVFFGMGINNAEKLARKKST